MPKRISVGVNPILSGPPPPPGVPGVGPGAGAGDAALPEGFPPPDDDPAAFFAPGLEADDVAGVALPAVALPPPDFEPPAVAADPEPVLPPLGGAVEAAAAGAGAGAEVDSVVGCVEASALPPEGVA